MGLPRSTRTCHWANLRRLSFFHSNPRSPLKPTRRSLFRPCRGALFSLFRRLVSQNELSVSSTALGLVAASPLRPRLSQVALPSPTPPGLSFSHRSSTTSTGLSRSYQSPRAPNVGSPKARPRARVAAIATCDAEKSDRDLTGNVDSTESQEKHPTINEKKRSGDGEGGKKHGRHSQREAHSRNVLHSANRIVESQGGCNTKHPPSPRPASPLLMQSWRGKSEIPKWQTQKKKKKIWDYVFLGNAQSFFTASPPLFQGKIFVSNTSASKCGGCERKTSILPNKEIS